MKIENWKLKIDPMSLHHGYLILGDRETARREVFDFLENELQVVTAGNPDFLYFDFNTIGIDEAREIAGMQERKGFTDAGADVNDVAKKFFVIGTHSISIEAQNALLKVFEEPTEGTHFFILASQNTFLPTFLSRLVVLKCDTNVRMHANDTNGDEKILEKSLPEWLAMIAKLAGDISDEKKVKQDAIDLVNQIESELYNNSAKVGPSQNAQALKECQFARNALFSRGAMIKMILENLVLQI